MGMYTELYLSCVFKSNLPKDVIAVLQYLFDDKEAPLELPDHPLFNCNRWRQIGTQCSDYFTPFSTSRLHKLEDIRGEYGLTTRFDLKNYDYEIGLFLDWIGPHLDHYDGDHLGHMRYEEDDQPMILYYKETETGYIEKITT